MSRTLENPSEPYVNLVIYDDNGHVVGGLILREENPYVNASMLYRYCSMFLETPAGVQWEIFHLNADGSTGRVLRRSGRDMVRSARYIVLDGNKGAVQITVTSDHPPRRVRSHNTSSATTRHDCDTLQHIFREGLRGRDDACAITGRKRVGRHSQYRGLSAAHIFPAARLRDWNAQNLGRVLTDTSPPSQIGRSGLYSLQNGLLMTSELHDLWDDWSIAIDPDDGFKVICFFTDDEMIGGRRLSNTAIHASNPNHRVSHDLLRWHLRMCVLYNMKGNTGVPSWEFDLGPDDVEEIMGQEDAGERMEAELFTRLAHLIV